MRLVIERDAQPWYSSHTTLIEVARYGLEIGAWSTAEETIDFFEKPWNWPEVHTAWTATQVGR